MFAPINTSLPKPTKLPDSEPVDDFQLESQEPPPPDFDEEMEPSQVLPEDDNSKPYTPTSAEIDPALDTSKTWGLRHPHRLEPSSASSEEPTRSKVPPPPAPEMTHVPAMHQNILHPSDLLPIEQRFERAAADDTVKYAEAIQLIRSMKAQTLTPQDEAEARRVFDKYRHVFTEVALAEMEEFFLHDVPRLHAPFETNAVAFARTPRDGRVNRAVTTTLIWDPVTVNLDKSIVDDLAGYKVLVGSASGNYSKTIDVNDPSATGFIVEDLGPGTWYFVVKAYDTSNNESGPSNEVSKVIQ
jgi:hypothetical protein